MGEFKLRSKLIAENYWTEKRAGEMTRNDRRGKTLPYKQVYNTSAVMLREYVKLKASDWVFV